MFATASQAQKSTCSITPKTPREYPRNCPHYNRNVFSYKPCERNGFKETRNAAPDSKYGRNTIWKPSEAYSTGSF